MVRSYFLPLVIVFITAVIAIRVGDIPLTTDEESLYLAIAQSYDLQVYPSAITLTTGVDRQILVGLTNNFVEPNLSNNKYIGR